MRRLDTNELRVETDDGTTIIAHVSDNEGKPIVFLNGLGGSWDAWCHQIEHFADSNQLIMWDYRGTYRSKYLPGSRLDVAQHALDAEAVLDATIGNRPVTVIAWSLGVQVATELYRRLADRIERLVLIGGVAGRTWETLPAGRFMKYPIPHLLRFGQRRHKLVQQTMRRVVASPELLPWAKRLGIVASELDAEFWQTIADGFSTLDMNEYLRLLEKLGEHDGWDVLAQIASPTLIVSGDRDRFTPRFAAEKMVRAIPGAEFMLVAGGTHYVAAEFPHLVNLRVEKFLGETDRAS